MYSEHEQELFMNGIVEPPSYDLDELDDTSLVSYWEQYHQGLEVIEKQRQEINDVG